MSISAVSTSSYYTALTSASASSTSSTSSTDSTSTTDSSYVTTSSSDQVANPSSTLDQSDFLQMLITKLENQDPLNVDDSSFTGDLAQYSSLASQQSSNTTLSAISTKLDDLNTNITSQTLLTNTAQAVSLTGKTVVINTTDSSGNSTGTVTGTVDVVKFVNGVPKLVVNGVEYDLSTVSEVS